MSCRRHRLIWLASPLLAALALAGCGVGGSGHQTPQVAISLTAPMTGATVGVDTIKVTGTVTPANATVRVGGLPATVRGAGFVRAMSLRTATTTIPVTAAAPGWTPATVTVTVHYSRALAKALSAAHSATWLAAAPASSSARTRASSDSGFVPSVDLSGGSNGGATSTGSGSGATGGHGGTGSPPTGTPTGSPPAGTPTGTPTGSPPTGTPTPPTGTPTGSPPTGAPTGGSPEGAPAGGEPGTSAPVTQAELEQLYLQTCEKASGGSQAASYCQCMYDHMQHAQVFSSRARVLALARRIKRFNRTHDLADLPKWLLQAQATCVAQLPTPPLDLGSLPTLHHPAAPARGAPSSTPPVLTTPSASGTPTAPAAPAATGAPAPAVTRGPSAGAGIIRLARRLRDRRLVPRIPGTR